MEKNIKKNVYICVYITESLFYTAEINTTLWTNYTSIKKKKSLTCKFLLNPDLVTSCLRKGISAQPSRPTWRPPEAKQTFPPPPAHPLFLPSAPNPGSVIWTRAEVTGHRGLSARRLETGKFWREISSSKIKVLEYARRKKVPKETVLP